jgi:hypothetical protein
MEIPDGQTMIRLYRNKSGHTKPFHTWEEIWQLRHIGERGRVRKGKWEFEQIGYFERTSTE